jgi:hypothetical protein
VQGWGQATPCEDQTTRRRRGPFKEAQRRNRRREGVRNALSENGECVPARGPSTSAEPQIRSDSEGREKEAKAPITALKWSGERRDEVEKDGVGYT